MTVRWKPLLVLSGLFLVIALVGVGAMVYALVPHGAGEILPLARAERDNGHFDEATIHYKRALQKDGRNPAIHEEMAAMYAEWAKKAPAEKKAEIENGRITALIAAAKFSKTAKEPRRQLLADALQRDATADSMGWAKEVLTVEPTNADARYVLAAEALEGITPNIPDVKRHLAALETAKASKARINWVQARLAHQTGDDPAMRDALARSRDLVLGPDASPVDRMALLRLRALDVQTTTDPTLLADRVKVLQSDVKTLLSGPPLAPARISRLSLLLEKVQKSLSQLASSGSKDNAALDALVKTIETDVEMLFKKALDPANHPELQVYLTYADHLRFRQKCDECLALVDQALKSPMAHRPYSGEMVMGLHAVASEAALAALQDKARFQKADPHIKKLMESSLPRYQGLGHLFQGAIELEQSGVGAASNQSGGAAPVASQTQLKLRASALQHLEIAATQLPEVAEAQARYGVALVLAQEQALGRQFLQNALRLGNLDPQYQIWTAWSMLQAGYPEDAEPIVNNLLAQVAQGKYPRDIESTLHLLNGEIHQSRRGPAELKQALMEFEKSMAAGQTPAPSVRLRLAQIDVQLGRYDQALERLAQLRKEGLNSPAVEHLAVLAFLEQGKRDDARSQLKKARTEFPDSEELVGLDAAMYARAESPKDADRVLDEFLEKHPGNVVITLMRAQVLTNLLDEPAKARTLLVKIADECDNTAPMVQLALLDLKQHDSDAVAATIARIRARWKEAAIADILDAQLALEQGSLSDAIGFYDAALKKDPGNKLVQFYKAQLDSRNGATTEAAQALEQIARQNPTKEVDSGLTLMAAAQSSLAAIALQNGDFDGAIHRLEDLRAGGDGKLGELTRPARWQLVTAYAAKGRWPAAKREIAALLNDPKYPATTDERVRAANLYRLNNENDAAQAQLDYVIKVDPAHTAAAVTRAFILANIKKIPEAVKLLRAAIAAPRKQKTPPVLYLMLAAVESLDTKDKESSKQALATLDEGLKLQPDAPELVNAKYRLIRHIEGPKAAVAYVESKAKADPKPLFRRMLVEAYRDQNDFAGAERVLRLMLADNPKDAIVAANLVRVILVQAADASEHGKLELERALSEKASGMIREFRTKFPNDLAFLQAECDLAARHGDLARATAVTLEMDKVAKGSPTGPLTRARIYAAQGRTREAADAYAEALDRNPRQLDVRILLGQASLKLGQTDEALRQAKLVLDVDSDQPDAVLLRARAIAVQPPKSQEASHRAEAVEMLDKAIAEAPQFRAAYHLKADIQLAQGEREKAIETLKADLKAVPEDATGLSQLVQHLSENRPGGQKPSAGDIADAQEIANAAAARDQNGGLMLAVAVGFHKAEQLDLALPWAEKAAAKLDVPLVHLNYGDLLLSIAERTADASRAKEYFRQAVDQYDLVLKSQANSIEAINNKAWILHSHLGESRAALELALGLLKRVDPATLPGEFFDTLGAIQEGTGRARDAEESYQKGLRKVPDHPVLNYHMGKLLAADRSRSSKANLYLEKAVAQRDRLSPAMASELDSVRKKLGLN